MLNSLGVSSLVRFIIGVQHFMLLHANEAEYISKCVSAFSTYFMAV